MFLLIATTYWLGFGLLAFTLARRSVWLAVLVPILALTPPAFVFVGIIWRDMLFATTWLLAAVIAFAAAGCGGRLRLSVQVVGDSAVRVRCLVASECADRSANPRRLHCVANAI